MIKYITYTSKKEKHLLKLHFQKFFYEIFGKKLTDKDWQHQFVNSPYNDSPLFLALDNGKIVGSALMIKQKAFISGYFYYYYLFTTSAILKDYRSKGVYAKLLELQKDYAKNNKADFIFAFPNNTAYPVLKLFGGFKDLKKFDLVKTGFNNLDFEDSCKNSLVFDDAMFNWRFEHKDYKFYFVQNKVIVFKKFQDCFDILAIYGNENFQFLFSNSDIDKNMCIITMDRFLKDYTNAQKIDIVNATYFPINKNIEYSKIKINLLMSDVY